MKCPKRAKLTKYLAYTKMILSPIPLKGDNHMQRDYCPNCKTIKNLIQSIAFKKEKNKKGKEARKIIKSFHCESCNCFVKSEE